MKFEIGDKVIWDDDYTDIGVIETLNDEIMSIDWKRAGLLKYNHRYWHRVKIVEKNKNNSEFKTVQIVKLEDYTGTIVEYKGRKYKLSLAE